MAMAPVGGGEVVLGSMAAKARLTRCLLTDAQVDVARQHALGEALGGAFSKARIRTMSRYRDNKKLFHR